MIVTITKENFANVLEKVCYGIDYSNYNSMCFSTGEVIRHSLAQRDLDAILDAMYEAGYSPHIANQYIEKYDVGTAHSYPDKKQELDENFSIQVDIQLMGWYEMIMPIG
jgi:hypothetical protein